MVAVTYGIARVPAVETPGKSWAGRFMDAVMDARMQQARREIRLHTSLLPYSLDERGNRLVRTGVNEMPFGA